jgi:DNA modification methylase
MTFCYEAPFSIIRGNAIEVLKQLPKVDCVITSPPYYQQRNYGTSASELGREPSVPEYIGNLVDVFRRFRSNRGEAFGSTSGTSEARMAAF